MIGVPNFSAMSRASSSITGDNNISAARDIDISNSRFIMRSNYMIHSAVELIEFLK